MQHKVAHKGQTAKAESARTDSKLTKITKACQNKRITHMHTLKCEKWWGEKKKTHTKGRDKPGAAQKGKDLRRCTKAEETVRRR